DGVQELLEHRAGLRLRRVVALLESCENLGQQTLFVGCHGHSYFHHPFQGKREKGKRERTIRLVPFSFFSVFPFSGLCRFLFCSSVSRHSRGRWGGLSQSLIDQTRHFNTFFDPLVQDKLDHGCEARLQSSGQLRLDEASSVP